MFRRTQDPLRRERSFDYRAVTSMAGLSRPLHLPRSFVTPYRVSYNPKRQAFLVRANPVSLAATQELHLLSLPPGT